MDFISYFKQFSMPKKLFFLIIVLFLFTGCSREETMEDFADRLVTNLAKDDYQSFKKEFLPSRKFMNQLFDKQGQMNYSERQEALKAMEENSPELFKRIAWRRISNDSLRQEIDWSKVEVLRVESETEVRDDLEGGKVEIFFHHQGIDCSLRFRSVVRGPRGKWKLMNYGDYGCMSGRYSKDKKIEN